MIKTYIIGTGNLSNNLENKIIGSIIYSAKKFSKNIHIIKKKKIKLI